MNDYTTLTEFVKKQMTKFGIEETEKKFLKATDQMHSRFKRSEYLGSSRNEADRKETYKSV